MFSNTYFLVFTNYNYQCYCRVWTDYRKSKLLSLMSTVLCSFSIQSVDNSLSVVYIALRGAVDQLFATK